MNASPKFPYFWEAVMGRARIPKRVLSPVLRRRSNPPDGGRNSRRKIMYKAQGIALGLIRNLSTGIASSVGRI